MVKTESIGAVIIKTLNQLKVDHLFATPGSEFGPIILEFAEQKEQLNIKPQLCAHEFLAVSMAYGAYFKTKRPQAVMTHANVGAANALIGLIGAHRMNIPMILIAGQTSQLERDTLSSRDRMIHWSQDSQSPSLMFKDYVKCTISITHESQVIDAIHRAHTLALIEPMGPVALSVSRDLLEKKFSFDDSSLKNLETDIQPPGMSNKTQEKISELLKKSERPVLISNRLEKNSNHTSWYSQILKQHNIACLRPEVFYQFGSFFDELDLTHAQSKVLNEADLIFVLDTDAPWVPLTELKNNQTQIVQLGPDPLFSALPLRSHKANFAVTCSIDAYFHFLQNEAPSFSLNRKKWIDFHKSSVEEKNNSVDTDPYCTFSSIAHDLSKLMSDHSVLINELSLPQKNLKIKDSVNYFRSGSASPLGWGLGFCLGYALEDSQSKVTHYCVIGDGVFHLSPLCGLMTAVENKTALVIIVLNNKKMQSVVASAEKYSQQKKESWPLTEFKIPFHYEKMAELVDGIGFKARTGAEFKIAFEKATAFTQRHRRPAIINVEIKN